MKINEKTEKMQKATGIVLRRYRKEKTTLTETEVGLLLYDVSRAKDPKQAAQQRVNKIETGYQPLRITDFVNYAKLYKISPDKILKEILKEYNRL